MLAGTTIIITYRNKSIENKPPTSALVEVSTVQQTSVPKTLMVYGTANFSPEQIQKITTQNEALVQKILVTRGQQVKNNDPLIQLSPTANANLNLKSAKIDVEFSKKEFNRLTNLRKQYLATNTEVQTAKQNLEKMQAVLHSLLSQQQNENEKVIHADSDGTIISIDAQPGQIVPPGTVLLSFANQHNFQVRLGIENEDLTKIHIGQQVAIVPLDNRTISVVSYIQYIAGQIDPNTGLIDAIVPLDNVLGLVPGSIVQGKIFLRPSVNLLVIPHSAVLYQNNKAYVFIDQNGKAEQRWITIDEDDGQSVSILNGLKMGDKIITTGNYELENGIILRVEKK